MTERQPPDQTALLNATTDQLAQWSEGIDLLAPDELIVDEPWQLEGFDQYTDDAIDAVEAQLAQALLHGDFAGEEATHTTPATNSTPSWWHQLIAGYRWLWRRSAPLVPVAALALLVIWSQSTPERDVLKSKGASVGTKGDAILYLLSSRLGRPHTGSFLQQGARVSRRDSISIGFRLAAPGGYVQLAWSRRGEAPAWLHRGSQSHKPHQIHYLKRKGQILKFPLRDEKPGEVCLLLLQMQQQEARVRWSLDRLVQHKQPTQEPDILASAQFCFVIQ